MCTNTEEAVAIINNFDGLIDMSKRQEHLSAYLDDALEQHEVDVLTSSNPDIAARYHIIGDAMRGELNEASMVDVSDQVHRAIAGEPALQLETAVKKASDKPGLFDTLFGFSGWLRPVGGLAVAASVAMVVVVGLQTENVETGGPSQLADAEQSVQRDAAIASTATLPQAVPTQVNAQVDPDNNVDLERYLDEHSEFAARDTMQGRLPYVRAVGYKSDQ